tara:strand:+ start:350 stop:529 length:180 start_codon:yes stop_codon:yes gene_type:complete
MNPKEFLTSYLDDFSNLVKPDKDIVHKLVEVTDLLKDVHADGKNTDFWQRRQRCHIQPF